MVYSNKPYVGMFAHHLPSEINETIRITESYSVFTIIIVIHYIH